MSQSTPSTDAGVGIHAFGGYIPKRRLQKSVVAAAHAWFNPALAALGKGERAIADWDEDVITMAVEAARDCLGGSHRSSPWPPEPADEDAGDVMAPEIAPGIAQVILASTTFPFQDRQNAGVVAEALRLGRRISTLDIAGSQRAGSSALIAAFKIAAGGSPPVLVLGSEKRRTRAASPLELTTGDAAAAFLVGAGEGVARLLAHASVAVDFVDHYRGQDESFDYVWEERWIRDEGLMKIVPEAIAEALSRAGLGAEEIDHFCLPSALRGAGAGIVKAVGLRAESLRDNLQRVCGEAGAAHPLVMLSHALESAKPDQTILAVGFGQGCDAIVLRTTSALTSVDEKGVEPGPRLGIEGHLKRRFEDTNYQRYLGTNDLVEMEQGLRAEADRQTGLTTLYRNREMIHGFVGGRCTRCGTLQFPKSGICVNPNCHATDTQVDYPFSEIPARIRSYTADRLTWSKAPPAYYGMVQFEGGGQAMIDFADIDPENESSLEPEAPMRMVFRIKDIDPRRGFRRYFWKAAPAGASVVEEG